METVAANSDSSSETSGFRNSGEFTSQSELFNTLYTSMRTLQLQTPTDFPVCRPCLQHTLSYGLEKPCKNTSTYATPEEDDFVCDFCRERGVMCTSLRSELESAIKRATHAAELLLDSPHDEHIEGWVRDYKAAKGEIRDLVYLRIRFHARLVDDQVSRLAQEDHTQNAPSMEFSTMDQQGEALQTLATIGNEEIETPRNLFITPMASPRSVAAPPPSPEINFKNVLSLEGQLVKWHEADKNAEKLFGEPMSTDRLCDGIDDDQA